MEKARALNRLNGNWSNEEPFKRLPASALGQLKATAEHRVFPKGAVLFQEREPAKYLFLILTGWVRLIRRISKDQILTLDIVTSVDPLCGLSAFTGGRYMATAVAATDLNAVVLPAAGLQPFMQTQARLADQVARLVNTRYRHTAEAYTHAFAPVERRIAWTLLRLSEDFGMSLPLTRREVAELAGTTVETAIRVTSRMRREKLLLMKRGQIVLVDPKALAKKITVL